MTGSHVPTVYWYKWFLWQFQLFSVRFHLAKMISKLFHTRQKSRKNIDFIGVIGSTFKTLVTNHPNTEVTQWQHHSRDDAKAPLCEQFSEERGNQNFQGEKNVLSSTNKNPVSSISLAAEEDSFKTEHYCRQNTHIATFSILQNSRLCPVHNNHRMVRSGEVCGFINL